mmetsp:Transcript_25014/g.30260  ORF Transcript_25014/g.30260 Transcript_25014/m.30260 type:complete len:519 (+) Transcript_25014:47-1603(+)|eukprot:CAMPEP_0197864986 /NCGR_PEP_ID=MMETSP1438-20131217/43400_1 /TAXON_ID=1461541 /ORGANISM="Pterosperma sp., Strain CCMP1384" /LENGTH=518 /DNA_ID=CAMNT_0043483373 /DNA_START=782 /DNA_END=2338 /DNA_ORIENTATION=-
MESRGALFVERYPTRCSPPCPDPRPVPKPLTTSTRSSTPRVRTPLAHILLILFITCFPILTSSSLQSPQPSHIGDIHPRVRVCNEYVAERVADEGIAAIEGLHCDHMSGHNHTASDADNHVQVPCMLLKAFLVRNRNTAASAWQRGSGHLKHHRFHNPCTKPSLFSFLNDNSAEMDYTLILDAFQNRTVMFLGASVVHQVAESLECLLEAAKRQAQMLGTDPQVHSGAHAFAYGWARFYDSNVVYEDPYLSGEFFFGRSPPTVDIYSMSKPTRETTERHISNLHDFKQKLAAGPNMTAWDKVRQAIRRPAPFNATQLALAQDMAHLPNGFMHWAIDHADVAVWGFRIDHYAFDLGLYEQDLLAFLEISASKRASPVIMTKSAQHFRDKIQTPEGFNHTAYQEMLDNHTCRCDSKIRGHHDGQKDVQMLMSVANRTGTPLIDLFAVTAPLYDLHVKDACGLYAPRTVDGERTSEELVRLEKSRQCCDCTHFCYSPAFYLRTFSQLVGDALQSITRQDKA